MTAETRHYRIGTVALSIESSFPEMWADCDRFYGHYRCGSEISDTIRFTIARKRSGRLARPVYVVRCNGEDYVAGPNISAVLPRLEAALNHQVMASFQSFFQLHAGVMSRHDQAVIFTGTSGTGKTTLAAALLSRGWNYLCDEFALIDPNSLLVQPFPKPLSIKESGIERITGMNLPLCCHRWRNGKSGERLSHVVPLDVRPKCVGDPCRVKTLLFMTRHEGTPQCCCRLHGPEAAMTIYRMGLNTEDLGRRAFDTAIALASHAQCYQLNLGSVEQTCALVESLTRESSKPRAVEAIVA